MTLPTLYLTEQEITHLIAFVGSMTRKEILNCGFTDGVVATGLKVRDACDHSEKFRTPNWRLLY